jgi:hypothetical protein
MVGKDRCLEPRVEEEGEKERKEGRRRRNGKMYNVPCGYVMVKMPQKCVHSYFYLYAGRIWRKGC